MGTAYLITSAGLFVLEIILQLYVIAEHSKSSGGLFVALLILVMAPLILVNFISAIQVTRTQDFSGKSCGRIICIAFHAFQLGLVWRSLKLLILFENKDWLDYLKMRLFHCGFHSLPFAIVLTYSMLVKDAAVATFVATVIISVLSASVALTTYQTGSKLYDADEFANRKEKIRKHVGLVFLAISTFLLLVSRCSSIVLFSVAEKFWIILPLCIQLSAHFIHRIVVLKRSEDISWFNLVNAFHMSFVSIFEMIRTNYNGVKCSYVLFYTVVFIQNLTFGFYWMLTANFGEMFKLMTVVVILLSFIIGIMVKFSSSGCIYSIESDILTEAFTNPELKKSVTGEAEDIKLPHSDSYVRKTLDSPDGVIRELKIEVDKEIEIRSSVVGTKTPSIGKKSIRSKPASSSASSGKQQKEYHNPAFVHSQGNISATSHMTHYSGRHSRESKKHSNNSHKHSRHKLEPSADIISPQMTFDNVANSKKPPRPKNINNTRGHSDESDQLTTSDGHIRRSMIRVSDTSIHANPQQTPIPCIKPRLQTSNADLASSNSRYSRNTHTLQSSVQNYGYNGFDDPFREKRRPVANKRNKRIRKAERPPRNGRNKFDRGNIYSMDYSLDSSELYPSMSSDTSSMTSYSNTRDLTWNNPRHKKHKKRRNNREMYDGYSTDVSNSDDFTFTDYSVDDSCSCSESSDSDGALTWPPSHTSNLADMYNIPGKVSSTDNIMHWLDTMASDVSVHDSFSTLPDPSVASDTDMSLSALQSFEIKKEHKRFRKLLPKPKEVFLKFRSLNYKDKQRPKQTRQFPLKERHVSESTRQSGSNPALAVRSPLPTMPLPIDSVQESIV